MSSNLRAALRWAVLPLLALAVGYALPRPPRPGDLLDAVAAVQRQAPLYLVSEGEPNATWARRGSVYLCRSPRGPEHIAEVSVPPWRADSRWDGIVCLKGTAAANTEYDPWLSDPHPECLHYTGFAVYGDPALMREVERLLAAAGYTPRTGRRIPRPAPGE